MRTSQAPVTNPFAPVTKPAPVRLIPLGGCGEFGMNLTAYLCDGRLFVVDCGIKFPEPTRLGVDAVLPDVDTWFAAAGSVHAYIITHGHEDHLGAMPYVLPKWPAPVYGTAWTIELLKLKLTKLGFDPRNFQLITVEAGDHVVTAGFDAEYVHINHSIPMACALFIKVPGLSVFHTGDFKFEAAPLLEAPADMARLAAIGREGVDFLLTDSTNAEKDGHCPGEASVFGPLRDVVAACPKAAIITTFSSNLWRLKTVSDVCIATGRKLYVAGAGIENALLMAAKLDIFHLPENQRVGNEQLATFPRERLVILATGCQGEMRSALARMARGEHRYADLRAGDTAIWSARMIPGNEKAVHQLTNAFMRAGVRVVMDREAPGIHVSGHAYGGDIDLLVQTLKPKHVLPVHGAFSQLKANYDRSLGPTEGRDAQLIETGDVFDLHRAGAQRTSHIDVDVTYVDGEAGVLISGSTLRDRLRIGELGCAIVSGVYARTSHAWLAGPKIELIGLSLPGGRRALEQDAWLERTEASLADKLRQGMSQQQWDPDTASEEARLFVRRQLQQLLRKKPVVTVKVHFL